MAKKTLITVPTKKDALKFLESIESSGTQYIDTGFIPNQDTRVVIDAQAVNTTTSVFFGGRGPGASNSFALFSVSGKYRTDYGASSNQISTSFASNVRRIIDKNKNLTTIEDTVYTSTEVTFSAPCVMTLFAINTEGTKSSYISAKLYSCQIYDNGTLIRDYVPCQNEAGEIGLYDKVNSRFYGNAGTGTFTGGEVVEEIGGETVNAYREAKKGFITVNDIYRKIKKGFITVNGVYRQFLSGEIAQPLYTGTYNIATIGAYKYLYMTDGGTLTIQDTAEYDLFVVGGGGGGGNGTGGTAPGRAGGGGGYTKTLLVQTMTAGETISVAVGSGGEINGTGGTTSIGNKLSATGGSPGGTAQSKAAGGGGGSGGGGGGGSGGGAGGKGGSDGSNGSAGASGSGGTGQKTTTRAFAETSNTLYAGGGGGCGTLDSDGYGAIGAGGSGGGGAGGGKGKPNGSDGTTNTGGGGGGGTGYLSNAGKGGSGIAIIRWKAS